MDICFASRTNIRENMRHLSLMTSVLSDLTTLLDSILLLT